MSTTYELFKAINEIRHSTKDILRVHKVEMENTKRELIVMLADQLQKKIPIIERNAALNLSKSFIYNDISINCTPNWDDIR